MLIESSVTSPIKSCSLALFGSCVTRDIFNSHFNENYKSFFNIVAFQNQTTIMSLMSSAIEYESKQLYPLEGWDRTSTESELNKVFLNNLIEAEPSILIVDFFADARFKTIKIKDSFLTANEWKVSKSDFFKEILTFSEVFIPNDEQLKESMNAFLSFMKKYLPQTKIILNKARGIYSYTNLEEKEEFFNKNFIQNFNDRWKKLDSLFIDIVKPIEIDVMNYDVKGYIHHRWSTGYVHYTPNFYHDFLNTLISVQFQNQIEFLKKSLARLVPSGLFPEEKLLLINEIRTVYISLNTKDKDYIENWLEGRYKEFLLQLSIYNTTLHNYVKFINFSFRNGIKGVVARDMSFSKYMIEKIIKKEIFNHEEISAYAYLTYGGILYGFFNAQKEGIQKKVYFKLSRQYLLLAEKNSKTDYVTNRSRYFLANLYSLNQDFDNSYTWYMKSLSCKNLAPNSYSLLFTLLVRSVDIRFNSFFKNIKKVFTKSNVQNKHFWLYIQSQIKNKTLSNNIDLIIKQCDELNSVETNVWSTEIVNFVSLFSTYLNSTIDSEDYSELGNVTELYKNLLLTEKGKAYLLFYTAELYVFRDDLSRAILMLSESNTMSFDNQKLDYISDILLENFSVEIRSILKENEYTFQNESVCFYCEEQLRKVFAWKRFLSRGCISGNFDEEVEFLEFLLNHTDNVVFEKVLNTRLAYLYYTGTAEVNEDHYITPDIAKSRAYFQKVTGNPLVNKYLQHPRLALYQDMEQYIDTNEEKYLFFENKESDELLIVFSCAGSYSRYTQLKLFYQKNKTNVLFINNPQYNWYHGSEWERIQKIIEEVALKRFKKENIISYFGSMGGYAALRVGLTYGFRTVIFNPQVDLKLWIKHRPSISVRLKKEKELVHLQNLDTGLYEKAPLYYIASSSMEDVEAFEIFVNKISLCKNGLFILEKIPDNLHDGIFGLTYKGREQEAILGLAKMQQRYYPIGDYVKLDNRVENVEDFWMMIKESMSLRIIIQIRGSIVYTLDIQRG
ncbi:MAG: Unknown protein [uncultured Sulfurovum sp.]|uniref:Uncharacterized protein n=1 Tax=uncultured Sulfurovum sp. TaxID=269237 RepID=A0A6S6TFS9_9BACT|nr:MAG: Unknown protein [uncultured Sulfurovum sp.]